MNILVNTRTLVKYISSYEHKIDKITTSKQTINLKNGSIKIDEKNAENLVNDFIKDNQPRTNEELFSSLSIKDKATTIEKLFNSLANVDEKDRNSVLCQWLSTKCDSQLYNSDIDLVKYTIPTSAQLEFIQDIESTLKIKFTGSTKIDAMRFISDNIDKYNAKCRSYY